MKKNEIKRILLLTPIYPGDGVQKSSTPVVHYFAREWVKNDIDVKVIHFPSNFPFILNFIGRLFRDIISSLAGSEIRTNSLLESKYEMDNVNVYRIPLYKIMPHGRYEKKEILKAIDKTIKYCESQNFKPDVIVSHWVNPQLEIMYNLKRYYGVPSCYVAHDIGYDLKTIYKKEATKFINEVDLIGYRSDAIKRKFESNFNCQSKPNFYCLSGIPSKYIEKTIERNISNRNTLLFVGTLIKRKYPKLLISAAKKTYIDEEFKITYVGLGNEEKNIRKEAVKLGVEDNVHLKGRLKRDEIVNIMDTHTIFVMISKNETFGLVYLEAMARGCITIASRNEGFDGIIVDGFNGFLCAAGDVDELSSILNRIKCMSQIELQTISNNAVKTAKKLTDEKVAMDYINELQSINIRNSKIQDQNT